MLTDTPEDNEIQQQLDEFLHGIDAFMLATINAEGQPEASYTPYVEHAGCYYIFVSGLASHTANLHQSAVASILFMGFEDAGHAYTRKRLSCQCRAEAIQRSDKVFELIMQLMEKQFGNLIATLRGLSDFQLFQLIPSKGNFVAGFGKAYEIDFSQRSAGRGIRHRRPD